MGWNKNSGILNLKKCCSTGPGPATFAPEGFAHVWKLVPLTVRPETKNRPKPKKKGSRIVFIASMCQGRVVKLAGCSCNIDSKGVGRLPFCCGNFYGYNT